MTSAAQSTPPPPPALVSIITITRNNAAGLENTLRSVVSQTYAPVELIVIDSASSDETPAVVERYKDHVTRWVCEPDDGIYHAMNKGIALARGQWLVFMNAADCFDSDGSLDAAMRLAPGADLIYSDAKFNIDGHVRTAACSHDRMRVIHQAMVYRKQLHDLHGMYVNAPGVTVSDYLFFVSASARRWAKCATPIARCEGGGVSSRPDAYYQKLSVDLITGRRGKVLTGLMLLAYPFYRVLIRPLVRCLRPGRI